MNKAALLAIMAATSGLSLRDLDPMRRDKDATPKNKFNLTEEEIESMKTMTPKEKKRFLKARRV